MTKCAKNVRNVNGQLLKVNKILRPLKVVNADAIKMMS